MKLPVAALAAAFFATPAPAAAQAQAFPARAVRLVVPSAPGAGSDLIARAMADSLARRWGQTVTVENRAGAGGGVGAEAVVNAAPDGHSWLLTTDAPITSNPHLIARLPYDPLRGLAPVTQIVAFVQMVVAHPGLPASTVAELVTLARARPGMIAYASFGVGTQPHLVFAMLGAKAGVSFNHVPYKGLPPALQATLAGEVSLTLVAPALARAHVEAGRLKPIAIAGPRRHALLPQVPTFSESGYPGIDPRSWFGMFAPAGTPADIVARVAREVAEIFADAAFRARVVEAPGFDLVTSTPAEFAAFVRDDLAYKGELIRISGAKPE